MERINNTWSWEEYLPFLATILGQKVNIINDPTIPTACFDYQTGDVRINPEFKEKYNLSEKQFLTTIIHEMQHKEDYINDPERFVGVFESIQTVAEETAKEIKGSKKHKEIDDYFYKIIFGFFNLFDDIQINRRAIDKIPKPNQNLFFEKYRDYVLNFKDDGNYTDKPGFQQYEMCLVAQCIFGDSNPELIPEFDPRILELLNQLSVNDQYSVVDYTRFITNKIKKKESNKYLDFADLYIQFKQYVLPQYLMLLREFYKSNPSQLAIDIIKNQEIVIQINPYPNSGPPETLDQLAKMKAHLLRENNSKISTASATKTYNKLLEINQSQVIALSTMWSEFIGSHFGEDSRKVISTSGYALDTNSVVANWSNIKSSKNGFSPKIFENRQKVLNKKEGRSKKIELTFALDLSGSIFIAKLDSKLKQALALVTESVIYYESQRGINSNRDILPTVSTGVVAYACTAKDLLPMTPDISASDIANVFLQINTRPVGSSTSDHIAIKHVINSINKSDKENTKIIFYITDGQPNYLEGAKNALKEADGSNANFVGMHIGQNGKEVFDQLWNSDIIPNCSGFNVDPDDIANQIRESLASILL